MTALALLAIVGALLLAFMKRFGASLVLVAFAVARYWDENMSSNEWVLFGVLFVAGLALTMFAPRSWEATVHRVRTKWAAVGALVLLVTVIMVVPWSWSPSWSMSWAWLPGSLVDWLAVLALVAMIAGVVMLVLKWIIPLAIALAVTGLLTGITALGFGLVGNVNSDKTDNDGNTAAASIKAATEVDVKDTATSSDTEPSSADPAQCEDGHYVEFDESKMATTLARFKGNGFQGNLGQVKKLRQTVADMNAHDPRALFVYYVMSPAQKAEPIDSVQSLYADGCFTTAGVQAYDFWLPLWKTADITPKKHVSHTGFNTGTKGGKVYSSTGVTGNDEGWDVGYKDAGGRVTKKHSVLKRCLNPTGEGKSPAPKGPTDNPKPRKRHHTPGGEGGCVNCSGLEQKYIRQSTTSNSKVETYKKSSNGGTPNKNDGATDSKGLQKDPEKDAADAKNKADVETTTREEQHQETKDESTVDGSGQEHGVSDPVDETW